MFVPLKSWMVISCLLIGALAAWYSAFETLPLPLSADDSLRVELAQRWAQKVASNVTRLPGRPQVAVARVVNDEAGILTAELKRWIGRRNVRMVNDQWYAGIGYWSGTYEEPADIEAAVQPLLEQGVDYVIAAQVDSWVTYPEFEMRLLGFVEILDGQTGRPVMQFQLSMPELIDVADVSRPDSGRSSMQTVSRRHEDLSPQNSSPENAMTVTADLTAGSSADTVQAVSPGAVIPGIVGTNPWLGLSGWLLVTGAIPMMISGSLRRLLRRRCNRTNAAIILTWLLAVISIAVALWIRFLPPIWGAVTVVFASVAAVVYFAWFCRFLEQSA